MIIKAKEDALKMARMRNLMTVDALAKKSGVTQTTVSRIENGKHPATPTTAKKLIEALDVDFNEVFVVE